MKVTNFVMLEMIESLSKFKNQTGIMGFAIAKNLRILRSEIVDCEKVKNDLIITYGDKNEDGNYYISESSTRYQEFIDAYIPVLNCEVDIDLYQIDADKFDFVCEESASVRDYELLEMVVSKGV